MKGKAVMKIYVTGMIILGFVVFCNAQEIAPDLKKDIEDLKQNQQIIIKELQSIKAILSTRPTPPPEINVRGMEIDLKGIPGISKSTAKLVMIEFTDYQCPYCGSYSRETFPQIKKLYVDSGIIDYYAFDLPLPGHQFASKAAEASHCAEEQGKYWEMHSQLMANQASLDKLSSYAAALNLDISKYEECLNSSKYSKSIAGDLAVAGKLGITSVPGFILAARDPKNPAIVKGISVVRGGAMPFIVFQKEIDQALANLAK